MIRNKTIKFNMDNEMDRELWEWLQTAPHGYFSDEAKKYFRQKMYHAKDPRVGGFNLMKEEKK